MFWFLVGHINWLCILIQMEGVSALMFVIWHRLHVNIICKITHSSCNLQSRYSRYGPQSMPINFLRGWSLCVFKYCLAITWSASSVSNGSSKNNIIPIFARMLAILTNHYLHSHLHILAGLSSSVSFQVNHWNPTLLINIESRWIHSILNINVSLLLKHRFNTFSGSKLSIVLREILCGQLFATHDSLHLVGRVSIDWWSVF